MKRMKSISIKLTIFLFLSISVNLFAYNRIVLLAPAAGDVFKKLHLSNYVVGVTKHIKGFAKAVKVGSHIKPNMEIISSLKPDLIVISSTRFFNKSLKKYVEADIFIYNPYTLSQILKKITELGKKFNKEQEAAKLVEQLKIKLKKVKKLDTKPKVIFEIMQMPYIVAGKKDIVNDIIEKAGGINIVNVNRKHVRYSYEKVIEANPDFYLFQVGPMNKNPIPPDKREYFKYLKSKVIKINEKEFSRPNTKSFDNVLKLNGIFAQKKRVIQNSN